MRTVRLYMTMTCDGCFAGPSGELDWMAAAADPDMNRNVVDLIGQADTAFMGYPTASGMIPYWHQAAAKPAASEGEHAIADAVNRIHSLVLSRAEEEIPWDNAELVMVRDDDQLREAVHTAKNQPGADIGVPGGIRTAQSFARLGLIDEYVFMMHPVALGEGRRIFNRRTNLDLHSAKTYRSGVTRLIYRPRQPERGFATAASRPRTKVPPQTGSTLRTRPQLRNVTACCCSSRNTPQVNMPSCQSKQYGCGKELAAGGQAFNGRMDQLGGMGVGPPGPQFAVEGEVA